QGGDVGVEEAVEATSDPVVVQRGQLRRTQAEPFGVVPGGPLGDAVQGLARDQEGLEQDQEGGRGGGAHAAGPGWGVVAEELLEAGPAEEAAEDRRGGDAPGGQGAPGGAGGPAGAV